MSVVADKEASAIALVYKSEDKWKGRDERSSVCYIATIKGVPGKKSSISGRIFF
jgi:hypothetical protein